MVRQDCSQAADARQTVRPVGSFSCVGFMDVSPGVRLDINITKNQIFIPGPAPTGYIIAVEQTCTE